MGRFLIHIGTGCHRDRRLSEAGLWIPGHPQIRTRSSPESASPAAASRPDYPVHPVHRCSIYSLLDGSYPIAGGGNAGARQGVVRLAATGYQGQRGFPIVSLSYDPHGRAGRLSEKSLAGYPPPHHRDDTPGVASSHDRVTPTGQKCRSILAPVVVEGDLPIAGVRAPGSRCSNGSSH